MPKPATARKSKAQLTKGDIVKLVTAALRKYTYPDLGAELFVVSEELHKRDNWWLVPVHTTKELSRRYPFYDVLSMAEEELQSGDKKIQLIPG